MRHTGVTSTRRNSGRTGSVFGPGLVEADAAVGSESVPHVFVGHLAIEPFRVEMAAGPSFGIAVLGIAGVGDDFEEAGIEVDAANILGGPGTRAIDTGRPARRRVEGEEPFKRDDVLPVVAEVIDVEEAEAFAAVEVAQPDLALVETAGVVLELGLAEFGIAVGQAADAELVEVAVPPAESGLDDMMQLAEAEAARHDQAPPDRRLDVGERDTDLQGIGLLDAHAGEYAATGDDVQPGQPS